MFLGEDVSVRWVNLIEAMDGRGKVGRFIK
jgi:hypothetical protein